MRKYRFIALCAVACMLAGPAMAAAFDGEAVTGFPGPAAGLDSIGVDALDSGSWVVYTGATVWYNTDPEFTSDWIGAVAITGPASGDAGFVAAAKAKEAALVGVGTSGALNYVDWTDAAKTNSPTVTVLTEAVSDAVFGEALDADDFLLSAGNEFGIVSLDANATTNTNYVPVVTLPTDATAGGSVLYQGTVYMSATLADGTSEIRSKTATALVLKRNALVNAATAAKADIAPFDWADATLLDVEFTGFGVTDVSGQGTLLVVAEADDGTQQLLYVDRRTGEIVQTDDLGDGEAVVVYNPESGKLLSLVTTADGVAVEIATEAFEKSSFLTILLSILGVVFGLSLLAYLVAWLFF